MKQINLKKGLCMVKRIEKKLSSVIQLLSKGKHVFFMLEIPVTKPDGKLYFPTYIYEKGSSKLIQGGYYICLDDLLDGSFLKELNKRI